MELNFFHNPNIFRSRSGLGFVIDSPSRSGDNEVSAEHRAIWRKLKMAKLAEELYKKALDLDERERADLVARLIESLDTEVEPGVEAAWLAEIEQRMEDLDSGKAQNIPWEEVRARLFRDVNASSKR
jgi:putative addiction module component (TIGR02574 family)